MASVDCPGGIIVNAVSASKLLKVYSAISCN